MPMARGPATESAQALPQYRWHMHRAGESLERAAAQFILDSSMRAILARGVFHIVVAGGTTPRAVYARLRECIADWPAWRVYFSDERCVPADHPDRNSRMALDALFFHVPVARAHFHAIPAERGARAAALDYAAFLKPVPAFDLVMLGLGEDGHTASLFPGADIGDAPGAPDVMPVYDASKPPRERVSLSAARLSRTQQAMFLVSGQSKRDAVRRWRTGADIPAAHIAPAAGVDVMIDAGLLA
jgi:6-phosphogluconolactonase